MTRFETCVAQRILAEGGLVADPDDPGGITKFGISQRAYPDLNIISLTVADATALYFRDYWLKAGCDKMPPPIDGYVFDSAINQGVGYAVRQLQELVGTKPDGVFGPISQLAVWRRERKELGALFLAERAIDYMSLLKFNKYGRGWLKRLFILAAGG